MFRILTWNLILAALLHAAGREVPEQAVSVYTSLEKYACKVQDPPEDEDPSLSICPGVGGYALKAYYADAREGLAVLDPSGREHNLNFLGLVSTGFSALGPKAEWRIHSVGSAKVPSALIVRFSAQEENGTEVQYLSVSKITPKRICLVEAIPPGPAQNEKAREAADRAGRTACMERRMH